MLLLLLLLLKSERTLQSCYMTHLLVRWPHIFEKITSASSSLSSSKYLQVCYSPGTLCILCGRRHEGVSQAIHRSVASNSCLWHHFCGITCVAWCVSHYLSRHVCHVSHYLSRLLHQVQQVCCIRCHASLARGVLHEVQEVCCMRCKRCVAWGATRHKPCATSPSSAC